MTRHNAVNPKDHKATRVIRKRSVNMGDGAMASFTFPDEFRKIQDEYAILFQKNLERDEFSCLAMMGFENGENLFLNDDDTWDARYIPMAMDVQPFLIGRSEENPEQQTMVIDMDSPRVSKTDGEALFDEQGQATPFLKGMTQRLGMLNHGHQQSKHYIEALRKYELLEPLSIDVTLQDGSKNRLMGFHTIHEEKLQSLETTALEDFQKHGWLLASYMVMASHSNLSSLIDRKNDVNLHG